MEHGHLFPGLQRSVAELICVLVWGRLMSLEKTKIFNEKTKHQGQLMWWTVPQVSSLLLSAETVRLQWVASGLTPNPGKAWGRDCYCSWRGKTLHKQNNSRQQKHLYLLFNTFRSDENILKQEKQLDSKDGLVSVMANFGCQLYIWNWQGPKLLVTPVREFSQSDHLKKDPFQPGWHFLWWLT